MRRNNSTTTRKLSRADSGYFAIVHVAPAKSEMIAGDSGKMTIEGRSETGANWSPGARALVLIALGSASWAACVMTANLLRRIIA